MAKKTLRRIQNVSGNFYVDETCIDCGCCRAIAPHFFSADDQKSFVSAQPVNEEDILNSLRALHSCPTFSIGTMQPLQQSNSVRLSFPYALHDRVYFCGHASENSFGAMSYMVVASDGNMLIDSPRYISYLAENIKLLGRISGILLTHRDDVADHEKFHQKFGAARFIHEADKNSLRIQPEFVIKGYEAQSLSDEMTVIPVPGHTSGSCVYLFKNKFLFTGDHLSGHPDGKRLTAFRDACWYSWPEQIKSMEKLLDFNFEWILPGHGYFYHASADKMKTDLKKLIHKMKNKN